MGERVAARDSPPRSGRDEIRAERGRSSGGGAHASAPGGALRRGHPMTLRTKGAPSSADRGGFVLIAALWALVFVGFLATAYLSESAHLARVSANRSAELLGRQAALGALERAENRLQRLEARTRDVTPLLDGAGRTDLTGRWNHLDELLAPVADGCDGTICFSVT